MATANITFKRCIQNYQESGNIPDERQHMSSRIYFDLNFQGKTYTDLYVDISQPYGTDYLKEPIEVGPPQGGYNGPFNHNAFSEAVESYYRSCIGEQGNAIPLGPDAHAVMKNNIISKVLKVQLEIEP